MVSAGWREEKSGNVIRAVCSAVAALRKASPSPAASDERLYSLFFQALHDATKLYCDALRELQGEAAVDRWSPELPRYFFDRPEECEDTLRIVASDGYRDRYYEKGASNG
ncbi:MAG TPA: hypothetical protein VFY71_16830 [Planctomycetota bacterium]|nr:hypothetical protein [Planctomycetota bacterium]